MRLVFMLFTLPFLLFAKPVPLLFSGNEKISSRDLYDALGLRLPYAIEIWEDKPSIEPSISSQSVTALTSYYRAKGYFGAKITPAITDTSITFSIQENDPIVVIDIQVNSVLDIDNAIGLLVINFFVCLERKRQNHFSTYRPRISSTSSWVSNCAS